MIVNWAQRVNEKVYRKNFDAIDWRHTPNEQAGSVPRQPDVRQSSHRKNLDSPAQVEPQAVSGVVAPVGSGAILPEEVVREQLAKIQTAIVAEREENVRAQLYQVYNELEEKQKQTNKQRKQK